VPLLTDLLRHYPKKPANLATLANSGGWPPWAAGGQQGVKGVTVRLAVTAMATVALQTELTTAGRLIGLLMAFIFFAVAVVGPEMPTTLFKP